MTLNLLEIRYLHAHCGNRHAGICNGDLEVVVVRPLKGIVESCVCHVALHRVPVDAPATRINCTQTKVGRTNRPPTSRAQQDILQGAAIQVRRYQSPSPSAPWSKFPYGHCMRQPTRRYGPAGICRVCCTTYYKASHSLGGIAYLRTLVSHHHILHCRPHGINRIATGRADSIPNLPIHGDAHPCRCSWLSCTSGSTLPAH